MKRQTALFFVLLMTLAAVAQTVVNGIPWYDQNGEPVSAHGANILFDGGRYYLFGEYKTDSANVFTGFSCYSSSDLTQWRFEGIAFTQQKDGRMGPGRVGERPKVLRCPATGEYVMLMHTDDMRYKDPCTCYATSRSVTGPYEFQGPILYKGKPVKRWDIGSFADDDGHAYLLTNHGGIYRLAPDFHSLDSCMIEGVKGTGESPAIFKKNGLYYWLSSHTTSWERNDNMYFTATSLAGPWTYQGEFAPKGTLTWNSQTTFVLTLPDGTPMFMGDRWSFPRQHQAATYVWLPLKTDGTRLTMPHYWPFWNPQTVSEMTPTLKPIAGAWTGHQPGDAVSVKFKGGRIAICGETNDRSAYADITITDRKGRTVVSTSVDFYSLVPADGVRYISPDLPRGRYTLTVRVADMKSNWSDKKRSDYGSKGYEVHVSSVNMISNP